MRELCVWVGVRHIRWSAEMGMGVPFEPGGTRRGLVRNAVIGISVAGRS